MGSKLTSVTHFRASDQLFSPQTLNYETAAMYYHVSEESSYQGKERLPEIIGTDIKTTWRQ